MKIREKLIHWLGGHTDDDLESRADEVRRRSHKAAFQYCHRKLGSTREAIESVLNLLSKNMRTYDTAKATVTLSNEELVEVKRVLVGVQDIKEHIPTNYDEYHDAMMDEILPVVESIGEAIARRQEQSLIDAMKDSDVEDRVVEASTEEEHTE